MNRKKIIVIIIFIVAIITTVIIWGIISSFHKLTLYSPNNISVSLYNKSDSKKVSALSLSNNKTSISLGNGDYCIASTDSRYSSIPACFSVDGKDNTINFNPGYSDTYLDSLLESQISDIQAVINNKYKQIISNYIVDPGKLMVMGDWYITTLTQKVERVSDQGDVYRIVLHKVNDVWSVAAGPKIVLSSKEFKDIPFEVLDSANRMIGVY